jgi:hypothetical protein
MDLFCSMVSKVAVIIAKHLETLLLRKMFTQLGSVQFERDVRALVAFFSSKGSPGVKSKLTRLLQLSKLLALDSPQELLEYWGANEGPVPWEFNAAEAKRLLGACCTNAHALWCLCMCLLCRVCMCIYCAVRVCDCLPRSARGVQAY